MREDMKYLFDKHVLPVLGQYAPRKITLTPLQLLVNKMAEDGYSRSAVKHIRTYLKACFEYAIDDEVLIPKNPARKLALPNICKKPCERFLTVEEVQVPGLFGVSTWLSSLIYGLPSRVRIVACDRDGGSAGQRGDILLIDLAVLIHNKREDSRHSIVGRPSHQTKTAHQLVLYAKIMRSSARMGTLPIEDAKKIPMIRG
jgi:hypothetical protein